MAKKKRIPKIGDHVAAQGRKGGFVVYQIDSRLQCAELKQIGQELALSSIPWAELTFLDELDESRDALRVVREAAES
jgi:hypothetical protein